MIFLGLDSGTQSSKLIALDLDSGEILASSQKHYGLIEGLPEGHLEQDPEIWVQAMHACMDEVISALGNRRREIQALGISGQQHGLVVLDGDDAQARPIRPAKLWCDTSTVSECEAFEQAFGGKSGLIERTGNAILPGYTIPKLLWLKRNEPPHYAKTKRVLLPHDYLNFRLTGLMTMEAGDASGTGVLNIQKREWDREMLNWLGPEVPEMFPELTSSRALVGPLLSELRQRWDLGEVWVSAGGGDNMMGAIGTGNVSPGVVTASLGTSGTLYAYSERPVVDPKGEVAAFCDSTGAWLPLVCTMNVTVVTNMIRDLFQMDILDMEKAIQTSPAGAQGLMLLPYVNGERTPNLPHASGVLHGIRTHNLTPSNLARAAMEGASLGLAYGLERFRELGILPREVRVTGGGSQSPMWRQILADIFGTEVVGLHTLEGAALGAALQAAHAWFNHMEGTALSYEALSAEFCQTDEATRARPDEARQAIYGEMLERFKSLTQKWL